MHLIYEDLARAQIHVRVDSARKRRTAALLRRAKRYDQKAAKAVHRARLARLKLSLAGPDHRH